MKHVYKSPKIPGSGKGWTLAVLAVGRRDADVYVKNVNRGGKFVYSVTGGGNIKADCGAVTQAAGVVLKANMERILNEV